MKHQNSLVENAGGDGNKYAVAGISNVGANATVNQSISETNSWSSSSYSSQVDSHNVTNHSISNHSDSHNVTNHSINNHRDSHDVTSYSSSHSDSHNVTSYAYDSHDVTNNISASFTSASQVTAFGLFFGNGNVLAALGLALAFGSIVAFIFIEEILMALAAMGAIATVATVAIAATRHYQKQLAFQAHQEQEDARRQFILEERSFQLQLAALSRPVQIVVRSAKEYATAVALLEDHSLQSEPIETVAQPIRLEVKRGRIH